MRFVLSTCAPGIELMRDEPETAQIWKFRKPIDDPLTSAIAINLANQIFPIVRDLAGPAVLTIVQVITPPPVSRRGVEVNELLYRRLHVHLRRTGSSACFPAR